MSWWRTHPIEPLPEMCYAEKMLYILGRLPDHLYIKLSTMTPSQEDAYILEGIMPEGCPDTPECDKLNLYRRRRLEIEEFLEWLKAERLHICECYAYEYETVDTRDLALRYLEIDPAKLEDERRALLEYQRSLNDRSRGDDQD